MTGREKVTYHLNRMSAEQVDVSYGPYHRPSEEDVEDAKYFHNLTKKNVVGTLSIKEAEEVSEMFEGDSPLIHVGRRRLARWVEIE